MSRNHRCSYQQYYHWNRYCWGWFRHLGGCTCGSCTRDRVLCELFHELPRRGTVESTRRQPFGFLPVDHGSFGDGSKISRHEVRVEASGRDQPLLQLHHVRSTCPFIQVARGRRVRTRSRLQPRRLRPSHRGHLARFEPGNEGSIRLYFQSMQGFIPIVPRAEGKLEGKLPEGEPGDSRFPLVERASERRKEGIQKVGGCSHGLAGKREQENEAMGSDLLHLVSPSSIQQGTPVPVQIVPKECVASVDLHRGLHPRGEEDHFSICHGEVLRNACLVRG